jgi:hypothetical protein
MDLLGDGIGHGSLLFGDEVGGNTFACEDIRKSFRASAVGDVNFDPGVGREFHGFEFGAHAAHGKFSFIIADVTEGGIDIADFRDELIVGRIEQAIDAREQDHAFGSDQFRDVDREHVVVSEAEFADRYRVVFVDDGEDAGFLKEAIERVEKVRCAGFGLDVLGGEEDLRDEDIEVRKQRAISAHQSCLSDSGAGLAGGDIAGIFRETHGGNPGADGTRGNEQAAMAFVDEF